MNGSSLTRLALVAIALAAVVALPGCLKQDTKTVLYADGSGKMSQSITLDLTVIKQLAEFAKGFNPNPESEPGMGDKEPEEPTLPFDLSELQEKAKSIPGLKIENAKQETKDGKVSISYDVTFADMEMLAKGGVFENEAVELAKNADGSFTLTMDPMAGQGAMIPDMGGDKPEGGDKPGGDKPGGDGMPGGMDGFEGLMPMFEMLLGGLEIKQAVTVPGTITETNGVKSEDGKTVTFTSTFKDMMAKKGKRTVTFKGEGLELKPFKYAPSLQDMQEKFMGGGKKKKPVVTPKDPETPPMDGETPPMHDPPPMEDSPPMDGDK